MLTTLLIGGGVLLVMGLVRKIQESLMEGEDILVLLFGVTVVVALCYAFGAATQYALGT